MVICGDLWQKRDLLINNLRYIVVEIIIKIGIKWEDSLKKEIIDFWEYRRINDFLGRRVIGVENNQEFDIVGVIIDGRWR